jgi:hypothetical protein
MKEANLDLKAMDKEQTAVFFEQILDYHFKRRSSWMPNRFKKMPRFTIYSNGIKDEENS